MCVEQSESRGTEPTVASSAIVGHNEIWITVSVIANENLAQLEEGSPAAVLAPSLTMGKIHMLQINGPCWLTRFPNYSVTECWLGQCTLWGLLMEMQWGVLKSLLILSPNFLQVPVCPLRDGLIKFIAQVPFTALPLLTLDG